MKYYRYITLLIVMIMSLAWIAGCGLVKVDPEKDRRRVVAEVDGDKILKGEFLDLYNQQKVYWGITEDIEKSEQYKDFIEEMKKDILEQLVERQLVKNKAKESGFDVNDGYTEKAREDLEAQIKQYAEFLKKQGEEEKTDEEYYREAREVWEGQLTSLGISEEEYIEMLAEDLMLIEFSEKMLEDVEVTDEDIQAYYLDNLMKQKEDPTLIQTAEVQLYRPPGMVRIKHITLPLPSSEQDEYNRLVQEEGQEEADKYLKEKLEAIKPKAQEVYEKAIAGESFESLIETYGDDTTAYNKDEGYVIYEGSGMFIDEIEKAILEMKENEISQPLESPYGYHIIKLYKILPEEEFSIEDKKEEIKTVIIEDKKNDRWNSLIEEWKEKAKIKKYENRL
ncbi:MAG: hypothetical protein GX041_07020 [Clostridiales bacterium]|jgi:foldase protein PrsA|nr:hypothetical protein [Clostridiales bacterium]